MPTIFEKASRDGRLLTMLETGLGDAFFPADQEFTIDQVRDPGFLPNQIVIEIPSGVTSVRPFTPLTLPEPVDADD